VRTADLERSYLLFKKKKKTRGNPGNGHNGGGEQRVPTTKDRKSVRKKRRGKGEERGSSAVQKGVVKLCGGRGREMVRNGKEEGPIMQEKREIKTFHRTGRYSDAADLVKRGNLGA